MKAVVYSQAGDSGVLSVVDRPIPDPGPGQVRVRIVRSAVNPTDWKARSGTDPSTEQVPNQDGAGVVDATGDGVDTSRIGEHVWIWQGARSGPQGGTAQEYAIVPAGQAVGLADDASFDLGASLGVPAITAHRCLTINDGGPSQLAPDALRGRTVLVTGGAGAVGNAAIQLAAWAGARVITTVSSDEKATLAQAAGAHETVNYRAQDAAAVIRELAPDGVDTIVEVAGAANAELDVAVLALHGAVAVYADDDGEPISLPVRPLMMPNARWQFVLIYSMPDAAKQAANSAVQDAVASGGLTVGDSAGLPLHHYPLEQTGAAHDAVEQGVVGKVLIDVSEA